MASLATHVLGGLMLAATTIPVMDWVIVLTHHGPKDTAYGVHRATAVLMRKWEEPADNWGEMRFCAAATEIGAEWTDHGTRREHRQLNHGPPGNGDRCRWPRR
jgi:hypothetical protein